MSPPDTTLELPKRSRQLRILVLLTDLFDAIGGVQTYNRCLVKALDQIAERNDWNIVVLVLNDRRGTFGDRRYFDPNRIRCRSFGRNKIRFTAAALLMGLRASIVIFGHVNFVPLAVGMHAIRRALPLLLIVHGLEVWKRLPFLQRLGVQCVSRILSVSARTRDLMNASSGLDARRIDVLPNTLDPFYETDSRSESNAQLSLPPGRIILSVARLDAAEQKGIDQVIEAMPTILKQVPDACFVVVGEGSDRPRLMQLAGTIGVEKNVRFTGKVPAVLLASYYRACDVFVLPSVHEGFGIVFLEAMFQGKPCIGVRAGAVPEVIADEQTGLLTPPGDVEALAKALVRLLTDKTLCLLMGHAGKERLTREFSFESFEQRLEAVLHLAVGDGCSAYGETRKDGSDGECREI